MLENVGVQFVIDDAGTNVYAQWDSDVGQLNTTTWWALQMASTLNVAVGLPCLYPAPTQLWIMVVDSNGKIELIGKLPNPNRKPSDIDLNQFKIIYEDVK